MSLVLFTQWSKPEMAERFAKMWAISVGKRYTGVKTSGDGAWVTSEGSVTIERKGDSVLVIESLDADSAAKARALVFGNAARAAAGQ